MSIGPAPSVPDINNSADNVIRQLDRIIANNTDTAQSLGVKLGNAKASLESAWNALNQPWEGQKSTTTSPARSQK